MIPKTSMFKILLAVSTSILLLRSISFWLYLLMSKLILQIALLFKIPITLSASFIEVLSSVPPPSASFASLIEFYDDDAKKVEKARTERQQRTDGAELRFISLLRAAHLLRT